jgi:hypothetical protein
MEKIKTIQNLLESKTELGELPYIAHYWTIHEIQPPPLDKACYSNFYNGFVFTDLPIKPLTTPFDF